MNQTAITRTVLHVGCGSQPDMLHGVFRTEGWHELRLDIDARVKPDIVASITDMPQVGSGSVQGLYSSHNLEHLYPHEVSVALKEFARVLSPDGVALITLPDLQSAAALVAEGKLEDPAYMSAAGPIAPIDIMYGYRKDMAKGNLFMAHRTGFTARTLANALIETGFGRVTVQRDPRTFALWALAFRSRVADEAMAEWQKAAFPYPVEQTTQTRLA